MSAQEQREWTLMIYMAADNDLDVNGVKDLQKMKNVLKASGRAGERVCVLAQYDRAIDGVPTLRYELTGQDRDLSHDVVGFLPETNTGDPLVLANFVRWAVGRSPARRYMVVLWNHGGGVDDEDFFRSGPAAEALLLRRAPLFSRAVSNLLEGIPRVSFIASDDQAKDFLDNVELKEAFDAMVRDRDLGLDRIDIVAMDACYMSMAEVYHQLRDSVSFAVGSEEITPTKGWPYDEILEELIARPCDETEKVADMMVDKYMEFYAEPDPETGELESVTQSACDLSKCGQLKWEVDELAKALLYNIRDAEFLRAVMLSHFQAQSFSERQFADLHDFCAVLHKNCAVEEVKQSCVRVMNLLLKDKYVVTTKFQGESVQHSSGLAIYFPTLRVSPLYHRLDFSEGDNAWAKFLTAYVEASARGEGEVASAGERRAAGGRANLVSSSRAPARKKSPAQKKSSTRKKSAARKKSSRARRKSV